MKIKKKILVPLLVLVAIAVLLLISRQPWIQRSLAAAIVGGSYLGATDVTFQEQQKDCGIAALHMVLRAWGIDADYESLRLDFGTSDRVHSMLELKQMAEVYGLPAHGWQLDIDILGRSPLPAVVHVPGHYVVVDSVVPDVGVFLRDPGIGQLRLSPSAFRRWWTKRALLFGPLDGAPIEGATRLPDAETNGVGRDN